MPLSVAMALSGVEPEHWGDDLRHFYIQGAAALHKPRRRSLSMSSASSAVSTESGISSMSSRSDQSSIVSDWHAIYNELVEKLEVLVGAHDRQQEDENVIVSETDHEPDYPQVSPKQELPNVQVMHNGRDILDLGSNISGSSFFTPYELPMGIIDDNYFQNRSQYSRVANVRPPPHIKACCKAVDCDFQYPIYF